MAISARYADFQPTFDVSGYNDDDSLALALASDLAYRGPTTIKNVTESWGFDPVKFIDVRKGNNIDTQCFLAPRADAVVIAFRGSEGKIADWLGNLKVVTDPGPLKDTKVHEGFQDALYPVIMELSYALHEYGPEQGVWLTGHSLGGALACLMGAMMLESGLPLTGIYTYGAPRVGDKKFEKAMNKAVGKTDVLNVRVVNEGDVVPHVPPEPWFSHAGERMLLPDEGERTHDRNRWLGFRRAVADYFTDLRDTLNVADNHRLNKRIGYLPKLQRNAGVR